MNLFTSVCDREYALEVVRECLMAFAIVCGALGLAAWYLLSIAP